MTIGSDGGYSRSAAKGLQGYPQTYPKLASPVAVTSAATNWTYGSKATLLAEDTLSVDFTLIGLLAAPNSEGGENGWRNVQITVTEPDATVHTFDFDYYLHITNVTFVPVPFVLAGALGQPFAANSKIEAQLAYSLAAGNGAAIDDVKVLLARHS